MAKRLPPVSRVCERCNKRFETRESDRFCPKCRKIIVKELAQCGFLEKLPWTPYRAPEKRQATSDGPSPYQENAIRDLEGN